MLQANSPFATPSLPELQAPVQVPVQRRTRRSYSLEYKRLVIQYVINEAHTPAEAAAHFNLNPSMVYRWIEQRDIILNHQNTNGCRRIGSGRHTFFPHEEQVVKAWIHHQWSQGFVVSYREIMEQMRELVRPIDPDFKASHQWLYGFLRRHEVPFADQSEGLVVDSAWKGGDEMMHFGRNLPRPENRPRRRRRVGSRGGAAGQKEAQETTVVQGLHAALLSTLQDGSSSHLVTLDPPSSSSQE